MDKMKKSLSEDELAREVERLRNFIIQFTREASEVVEGDDEAKEKIADEVHEEMERLRNLVFTDELTQINNRRGFYEHFLRLFEDALYIKKNPDAKRGFKVADFSIIFVDADNFKKVNDTYGHDAGDVVLKGIAKVLGKSVRDIDGVARLGGEEFIVALVGAGEDEAFKKGEEIRTRLHEEVKVPGNDAHPVTASVGVAALSASDADDLDELVGYADAAMYEAKANRGKNNTVRYSEIKGKQ